MGRARLKSIRRRFEPRASRPHVINSARAASRMLDTPRQEPAKRVWCHGPETRLTYLAAGTGIQAMRKLAESEVAMVDNR
jgi:hypothetical protein